MWSLYMQEKSSPETCHRWHLQYASAGRWFPLLRGADVDILPSIVLQRKQWHFHLTVSMMQSFLGRNCNPLLCSCALGLLGCSFILAQLRLLIQHASLPNEGVFFLLGTAFLLWYLFCAHMSGMYHGATCGSQLCLPPRCPTGFQDSHHSAPGRCSARTTGHSSKILPTWILHFPFFLPACLLQGKVSGQKTASAVNLLTLFVLSAATEAAVELTTVVLCILQSCHVNHDISEALHKCMENSGKSSDLVWQYQAWLCLYNWELFWAALHARTESSTVAACD